MLHGVGFFQLFEKVFNFLIGSDGKQFCYVEGSGLEN